MILYHVTSKDLGIKIWNDGLKFNPSINKNRKKRESMREDIDRLASERYNNYVPRKNAIFGWTTFDAAERYATANYTEPAIVEFNINGRAWCVEEYIAEDLYSEYTVDDSDKLIDRAINYYREWSGERNKELEVWLQQESVGKVIAVVDEFGNPF